MAYVIFDRIGETSTSTGTGNLTLSGAINASYKAFSVLLANGDTFPGLIVAVDGTGNPTGEWETGEYTWNTGGTIQRTTIFESSNANAVVNFAAGTKRVYVANVADRRYGTIQFNDLLTDPATPTEGLLIYAMDVAGRNMLKWVGPSGLDTPIQPNIFFNNVSLIGPGNATTVGVINCAVTNVGTISHPALAATNLRTQTRRFANTSAATAAAFASTRAAATECWRGNAAGLGGFFAVCRFGLQTLVAGNRGFFGLVQGNAAPTNIDPLTDITLAKVGIGFNANTGNLSLVNSSTTAVTVLNLGANFPASNANFYELVLFAAPNAASINYRIRNLNLANSTQLTGSLTTNIPSNTTFLSRMAWMTNNATAAAVVWEMSRFGLETDY